MADSKEQMMRRILLILTVTGFSVLASASDAFAQRRGYGGWGVSGPSISVGFGRGGVYSPYGYNNAYYGNRYYGNSNYRGQGYSPYYQGFGLGLTSGDYQPYYGSRVIVNRDYYTTPGIVVNPSAYSNFAPATQSFYSGPGAAQGSANVKVLVPDENAEVWFDNATTAQRGRQRSYESSPLQPNKNYTYTIKARWLENGQAVSRQRRVDFQAGQSLTVDFREVSERSPAPASRSSLRD